MTNQSTLRNWAPAELCQAAFLTSVGSILGAYGLPSTLRNALFDYGARRVTNQTKDSPAAANNKQNPAEGWKASLLRLNQVPHSWFLHYYALSVFWSAFWAREYLTGGRAMKKLIELQQRRGAPSSSTNFEPVLMAWSMLTLQGCRRLFESLCVVKSGSSRMLVFHWLLGIAFYTTMNISVWIGNAGAISNSAMNLKLDRILTPKYGIAWTLFLVSWWQQNSCHRYLASLVKYTLPNKGLFRYIISPHYFCECGLYLAMSIAAAPPGSMFNKTMLCGLAFVVTNLGITAKATKRWYADRFGEEKVKSRWAMLPPFF